MMLTLVLYHTGPAVRSRALGRRVHIMPYGYEIKGGRRRPGLPPDCWQSVSKDDGLHQTV